MRPIPKFATDEFGLHQHLLHRAWTSAANRLAPIAVTACGEACHPDRRGRRSPRRWRNTPPVAARKSLRPRRWPQVRQGAVAPAGYPSSASWRKPGGAAKSSADPRAFDEMRQLAEPDGRRHAARLARRHHAGGDARTNRSPSLPHTPCHRPPRALGGDAWRWRGWRRRASTSLYVDLSPPDRSGRDGRQGNRARAWRWRP